MEYNSNGFLTIRVSIKTDIENNKEKKELVVYDEEFYISAYVAAIFVIFYCVLRT